ncbi:unnamed protein product, partial [Rotaria sordida]
TRSHQSDTISTA